jgi:hypothetical protein
MKPAEMLHDKAKRLCGHRREDERIVFHVGEDVVTAGASEKVENSLIVACARFASLNSGTVIRSLIHATAAAARCAGLARRGDPHPRMERVGGVSFCCVRSSLVGFAFGSSLMREGLQHS